MRYLQRTREQSGHRGHPANQGADQWPSQQSEVEVETAGSCAV